METVKRSGVTFTVERIGGLWYAYPEHVAAYGHAEDRRTRALAYCDARPTRKEAIDTYVSLAILFRSERDSGRGE
jgi:hypothetical protein